MFYKVVAVVNDRFYSSQYLEQEWCIEYLVGVWVGATRKMRIKRYGPLVFTDEQVACRFAITYHGGLSQAVFECEVKKARECPCLFDFVTLDHFYHRNDYGCPHFVPVPQATKMVDEVLLLRPIGWWDKYQKRFINGDPIAYGCIEAGG